MDKTQILALARSLGLAVEDSMTITEITALIATSKPVTVADATNPMSGVSYVTGFTYISGHCKVTLVNGVNGIVGTSSEFPFVTMLSLKGTKAAIRFERLKDSEPINNVVYKRYSLLWSLE